ncbi:PREDICTED: regulator of G-protein signaling 6-like, partial [Tauraco erythrolophus]
MVRSSWCQVCSVATFLGDCWCKMLMTHSGKQGTSHIRACSLRKRGPERPVSWRRVGTPEPGKGAGPSPGGASDVGEELPSPRWCRPSRAAGSGASGDALPALLPAIPWATPPPPGRAGRLPACPPSPCRIPSRFPLTGSPSVVSRQSGPVLDFWKEASEAAGLQTEVLLDVNRALGKPVVSVFDAFFASLFAGADIVQWLMKNLSIEDPGEAIHLGSLIAAQGYVFPISDHVLTLKDDGTFYRFQAPYFWPSNCWEPENTDYAIYLCKRTMQNKARLELADYEAENLARLQRAFARKWEFIFMQAEAQVKIDRKKDKTERKILDSQERAFWDVHRPVPGCVNTTEMDIRKCRRMKNPQKVKKSVYGVTEESQPQSPVHMPSQPVRKTTKEDFRKQITFLNMQIERHCLKMSKVAESLIAYTEQYVEYDPFITPAEPSNPWISDDAALWDIEM